jgi:hypothetical protein
MVSEKQEGMQKVEKGSYLFPSSGAILPIFRRGFKRGRAILRRIRKIEAALGMPECRFSGAVSEVRGESRAILPGGVEVRVKNGRLMLFSPMCEFKLDIETGQWQVLGLASQAGQIKQSCGQLQLKAE